MSLAVLGLVLFQHDWMRQAINANSQQFDKQVLEAMQRVSRQVTKQEAYESALRTMEELVFEGDTLMNKIRIRQAADSLSLVTSSSLHVFRTDLMNMTVPEPKQPQILAELKSREEDMRVRLKEQHHEMMQAHEQMNQVEATYERIVDGDTVRGFWRQQDTAEENRMFTIVVNENSFETSQGLQDRLARTPIDSLLSVALLEQGIDLPYQYGVIDLRNDTLALANAPGEYPPLKHSKYQVSLFEQDFLRKQPALLSVHFPDRNAFIWRQIAVNMGSSILLIAVILFCFVYAIRTILRQKKLSEIKNDFINNMTHEFKTPVATVGLAVEALQDASLGDMPELRQRYLQIIGEENRRLGMQVEKVLQIATLDRQELKLKLERTDVHAVIETAMEKINLQVAKREGTIRTQLEARPAEVDADPLHLTNIIFNLLDNANKYSLKEPDIEISTRNQKNGLWITVADRGMGMTREVINKIFDKFYRVPTGNLHDVKGFGLGLAYVKAMVEAHHGEIRVKSQPNEGSTFELFIPYTHE